MKNGRLFLKWQKGVFVCFLSGFNVIVVCFCVSGKVANMLKMLVVFPDLGAFWGGLFLFIWVWKV